jgi:peptide chain release factor subunit 1
MALSSADRFHLKKFIKDVEQHKGRHTELVSVYVPQGYDLNKIISHLSQEQGTATNIKSKSTRDNVIASLEKMLQHLKLFKKTPNNGLALFAANVAEREGQQDYEVWSIEPPIPINIRIYRCDKEFVLEPLQEMLDVRETYGLVVMDRRDGIIALLKGKAIVPLSKASSNVPGKTKAGGQSAHRYERIREGAAKDFYRKLGEMMKKEFLELTELKGIIVGGPGPTKYEFVDGNNITDLLKRKIIAIKDLSYTEEFGLQELVDKSADVLANEEITEEKEIMQKFFELLSKKPKMVSYGEKEVIHNLNIGVVDVLLLSEEYDENKVLELEEIAVKFGTVIKMISTETREGVQLKALGEIAAILRYEV